MRKKIGIIVILFLIVGGLALAYRSQANRQAAESLFPYNHMGDLRFRFRDYEEVKVKHNNIIKEAAGQTGPGSQGAAGKAPAGTVPGQAAAGGSQGPPAAGEDSLRGRIEQDYMSRLESLAHSYEGRLNGLLAAAWIELNAAKKADPNADIRPLVNKYYAAGKALEAECDSRVYSLLDAFEGDLRSNSLPADAAVKARQTYESRKQNRAAQILSAGR